MSELLVRVNGTDYPFPSFDTISYSEARLIKQRTRLVMGQFYQALEDGDPDALLALALIAKQRDNRAFNPEELDHLLLDQIELVLPEGADLQLEEQPSPASPLDDRPPGLEASTSGEPAKSDDAS